MEATHIPDSELVDLALGRLDPARREAVERACLANEALDVRARAIRRHLARYEVLARGEVLARDARAPAFGRILARLPAREPVRLVARPAPGFARTLLRIAAVASAVWLLLLWAPWRPAPVPAAGVVLDGRQAGAAGTPLGAGDRVHAHAATAVLLDGWRVDAVLDRGSQLELTRTPTTALRLLEGRAWFDVGPGPFRVHTAYGDVVVRGTEFEIAVDSGVLEVRVAEGRVQAGGHVLEAGQALVEGKVVPYEGALGSFYRRPTLTIQGGDGLPRGPYARGDAVELGFAIAAPGHVTAEIGAPDGVHTALWLEVVDPAGEVHDLPVSSTAFLTAGEPLPISEGGSGGRLVLVPGDRRVLYASFASPFADRGTYRCRALYRPVNEPPLVSNTLTIEVR